MQFFGEFLPNPIVPLFPAMDIIVFAGIIMSLLAIVFGYDAVCGEKEIPAGAVADHYCSMNDSMWGHPKHGVDDHIRVCPECGVGKDQFSEKE